ncbi:MAG: DUF1707 domain-containing protein [Actinomycetia bacterium]|nr:DUF1707 domain-containing protein [Actinomycetes bacterium]
MDDPQLEQERAVTIKRLHGAAGDGRLTLDEADERIATARAAASAEALGVLVGDLGSPAQPAPVPIQVQAYPGREPAERVLPGSTPDHPLVVQAGWDSVVRKGEWTVPAYVAVSPRLGSVKLDCLLAKPAAPVISMTVSAGAGSVVVVVPQGWAANIDELGHGIGSARSTVPTDPEPGCPVIFVSGTVGIGSFRVRHPSWFERRRARKALAKRREIMR